MADKEGGAMTIEALIKKLSAAEEGSRELDGLIAQALGLMPLSARWEHRDSYGMLASDPIWVSGGYGDYKFHDPEPYTTSLDAAIALVWRQGYKLHAWEAKRWFIQRVSKDGQSALQFGGAAHNNIAIALCLSLLRALQAMEA